MRRTSFRNLGDGNRGDRIAWNQDHHLLLASQQSGEQLLADGDISALHDSALMGFLRDTDTKIVFHRFHPF